MIARNISVFLIATSLAACVTPDKSELVPFSAAGLIHGITVTESACRTSYGAVWVTVDGKGDCIRYFKSGVMPDRNDLVYVWFHGDRVKRHGTLMRPTPNYESTSNIPSLQARAHLRRQFLNRPYIQISRPGVYGSSGEHGKRRSPREVMSMNGALDKIKKQFNIRAFILTGQSGGGHIVASLLAYRDDILCAVITSGVTSVKARYRLNGDSYDPTGQSDDELYDPIDHVAEILPDPKRQVYVIADPRDRNVPASTQRAYADALNARGVSARYIEEERGTGSQHHGLEMVGLEYALKCEAEAHKSNTQ